MARKFCFCVSNLKAAKILGVLFTFGSLIGLIYYASITLTAHGHIRSPPLWKHAFLATRGILSDYALEALIVITVYYALQLLCELCLLVGAFKEKAVLMKIWLICAIIVLLITVIGAFLGQYSLILPLALHLWAALVVYGAIQEVKEEA